MAGELLVPGQAGRAGGPLSPEQEAAITVVQNLAPLLVGIQNQLETLIRMEAGVIHRTTVRKRIMKHDTEQLSALMEEEATDEDSG